MDFRKILVLACVMLSVSDMHGNGPLRHVVPVSVFAAASAFSVGVVFRSLQALVGSSTLVSAQEITDVAAYTGLLCGIVTTPIACGEHARCIKDKVLNTKWHYADVHGQASRQACKEVILPHNSSAKKLEYKKEFIATQLALYKLNEHDETSSLSSCSFLDYIPLFSTAFGLVPAVLCGCSNDFLATILAANYCAGGVALLQTKIEENKWNRIKKSISDLFVFGRKNESNIEIQIPDNFMKAAHLKIAIAQRRADEIYAQERRKHTKLYPNIPYNYMSVYSSMRDNTDALIHDEVRSITSQVIKLDDAALSAMDYESRVTKKFEVQITRNEKNTERIVHRIEK